MGNSKLNLKLCWLATLLALTLIMILLGGATRMSRSGLSIVEWKPITGIVPPLTSEDWNKQFMLYQESPEYKKINYHFKIDDYKNIFILEYLHRFFGRIIFLFTLIPGIILWQKKLVSIKLVLTLSFMIALQGLIGWLMVKSGLNENPQVSPFMLAAHFIFAVTLLVTTLFNILKKFKPLVNQLTKKQELLFNGIGLTVGLQIFLGCLTSGLKAGFIFNTFPLMGGRFFPAGESIYIFDIIANLKNPSLVQWLHRWLGIFLLFIVLIFSFLTIKSNRALRPYVLQLATVALLQVILGIFNIIFSSPTPLAIMHQATAALFVLIYFNIKFRLSNKN